MRSITRYSWCLLSLLFVLISSGCFRNTVTNESDPARYALLYGSYHDRLHVVDLAAANLYTAKIVNRGIIKGVCEFQGRIILGCTTSGVAWGTTEPGKGLYELDMSTGVSKALPGPGGSPGEITSLFTFGNMLFVVSDKQLYTTSDLTEYRIIKPDVLRAFIWTKDVFLVQRTDLTVEALSTTDDQQPVRLTGAANVKYEVVNLFSNHLQDTHGHTHWLSVGNNGHTILSPPTWRLSNLNLPYNSPPVGFNHPDGLSVFVGWNIDVPSYFEVQAGSAGQYSMRSGAIGATAGRFVSGALAQRMMRLPEFVRSARPR